MERCRYLKPARTAVSKVDIGRKELAALTESAETHGRPFDIESESDAHGAHPGFDVLEMTLTGDSPWNNLRRRPLP